MTGVVSAEVQPGALPPVFQYTEIWSPPTLIRGVAPGGLLPITMVWLALAVVRIQASNVAASADTDSDQFPPTLPHPLTDGKSSTGPVTGETPNCLPSARAAGPWSSCPGPSTAAR